MSNVDTSEIQRIFVATINNCCCNPKNICQNCVFKYDHSSPRNKIITFDIFNNNSHDNLSENIDYIVPVEQGHLVDW